MKTTLAIVAFFIAATALSLASTVIIMRASSTVTCNTAGSSAFSADPETDGSWNADLTEDATAFTWDSTNNRESCSSAGSAVMNTLTYTAAASTSSDMWVKVTVTTISAAGVTGVTFRRSTSGGARYVVRVPVGSALWGYWDGGGTNQPTTIETLSSCPNFAAGDTIGFKVTGTGNDTVLYVWRNPSGTDPDDWGAPCHTATSNPATAVDSGTYAGLFLSTTNATRRTAAWDDFSVGSCQ